MVKPVFALALLCCSIIGYSQTESSLATGRKQYQDENYAEALKSFTKASSEEPGNAQVPYLIAHVYSDMSNYRQAATYFEKAISMDSSHSNWIYECGLTYYSIPDYKRSLQYIQLAGARGYKKTNDYLENLANAFVNVGQFDKAIDIYRDILLKKPSDQEITYQLAQAYFNANKYQEAIDTFDKILSTDQSNAEALYMAGVAYIRLGDKARGQQLCDKAIVMDPALASKRKTMGGGGL